MELTRRSWEKYDLLIPLVTSSSSNNKNQVDNEISKVPPDLEISSVFCVLLPKKL